MKSINKMVSAALLAGTLVFAITGCEKTLNDPGKSNFMNDSRQNAAGCSNDIPDSLQVPDGNKLTLQVYAKGVQIYQVQQSLNDNNVYLWVNIAPSATLYAKENYINQLGIHYKGPTWEFTKGRYKDEKVIAKKLRAVTQDATAIPWLLLQAVDSLSSAGNAITYIQRIYTEGGLAPAKPATQNNLGELDSIPYTAVYRFYEAKH